MAKLNPRWLKAAWVLDAHGSKAGVVAVVGSDGDTLQVVQKGATRFESARALDQAGRLLKENAVHRKYLA